MMRTISLLISVLSCVFVISCSKDQEEIDLFRQEAQGHWAPLLRIYEKYSSGFILSRGCHSEYDYHQWAARQISAGVKDDFEQLRKEYLDEASRTPDQLLLLVWPENYESRTPGNAIIEQLEDRHALCTERYIDRCVKTGKYKEYHQKWNLGNTVSYGTPFLGLSYSDVSIVSMEIVSSKAFFKQSPGMSLVPYFNVILFPSTDYLVDGDGNVVDEGPIGGMWYTDYNVRPLEGEVEWTVEKFLSYKPRILPFGLQMYTTPSERPSVADFTVTIVYSDGTECSSSLSAEFPY